MNLCSSVRITHATSVTLYAYRYAPDPADFLHFASMFNQLADATFRPHCSHAVLRRDLLYSSLFVKKNDSIEKIKKNVTKLQKNKLRNLNKYTSRRFVVCDSAYLSVCLSRP